jgi:hypothetical protein
MRKTIFSSKSLLSMNIAITCIKQNRLNFNHMNNVGDHMTPLLPFNIGILEKGQWATT